MSYFGNQLLKLRKKEGLSQEEFAYRIGVSRQIVSRWENGVAIPRSTKVKIICDEFKISPDILFGTEESIGKNESHPVAKKRFKLVLKGIATILIILFILYVIYAIYKACIINYIEDKFKEYDNWTNYYAEIKTYDEAELVSKREIWYKDNKYKIISKNYKNDKEIRNSIKWIDCNNNLRAEFDFIKNEIAYYEDFRIKEFYKDGKYIFDYFPWIMDIKDNKYRIIANFSLITISTKDKGIVIKNGKKILSIDKDTNIPTTYSDLTDGKISFYNYVIRLDETNEDDVEIKKDL